MIFDIYVMGSPKNSLQSDIFFVGTWKISDKCYILLTCYDRHVPAFVKMISFLLVGNIFRYKPLTSETKSYSCGVCWVHIRASRKQWNPITFIFYCKG